jgi:hypothetical protein
LRHMPFSFMMYASLPELFGGRNGSASKVEA